MSNSHTVTLTLPTRTGTTVLGPSELWIRHVDMGHLPNIGELISLRDDGESYLKVMARFWSTGGFVNLDLQGFVIDPTNDTDLNHPRYIAWHTTLDGDLTDVLTSNGWNRS